MEHTNPFRHPVNNARFTRQLFYEMTGSSDKDYAIYSLKDRDHKGYPSLYRLYMETDDPTEYEFATKYLDGWEHWNMLCNCDWFQPFVARWREELRLREAASRIRAIRKEADEGGRNALAALKYLLERGWEDKKAKRKPTRKEVSEEVERHNQEKDTVFEQAERIGLTLIK
jgi:hypothetical protein